MTDSEVENLKTPYDINFVKQFLPEHGERRSIEEISAVELNNYLSKFMSLQEQKKGKSTNLLHLDRGILSSVERHPRGKDNDFQKTRNALKAKQRN